ncbi:MAG: hypothetical protein ABUL48_05010, partial [Pseudorhodoplanes sp.]
MGAVSKAVSCILALIALYFALLWGAEASRVLTSPVYGLDNPTFGRIVHGLGRLLHVGPDRASWIATACAAAEFMVACLFICHIVDRCGSLFGRKINHASLEAALILVAVATLVAATPALLDGDTNLLRLHALHLVLAGVAAMLSVLERIAEHDEGTPVVEHAEATL